MGRSKWKYILGTIAYTVGLVLIVIHIEDILRGIGFFLKLLKPLGLGIVIAFVLNHPYEHLRGWFKNRWKLSQKGAKISAILSVYLLALGALAALACIVAPELSRNLAMFVTDADSYLADLQQALNEFTSSFGVSQIDLSALIEQVDIYLGNITNAISDFLPQIIEVTSSLIARLATGLLALALSIYIMSGKERLLGQVKRCLKVYLPAKWHDAAAHVTAVVYEAFDNYVAGQCKEAVILGTLCFVGMMILRLDYAGIVSVVVGVTALVPILGAYIGGAVGVILLLFVSPVKALVFLIFLILLQQVEGNVIYPKVVGRKIGLPGMWVLLAIGIGGGLWGVWGMLIGVPLTTVFYQLLRQDVLCREGKTLHQNGEQ